MPETIQVEVAPSDRTTALLYAAPPPDAKGITLILGHGAGAPQRSAFMVTFANELAQRGIDTVTFNFLYTEHKRRRNDRLEQCYRAVIDAVRERGAQRLAIGGKSMGGRIASQVAASGPINLAGLVFFGYPLHPPGKPDQLRSRHLPAIRAPMLFVQGSRDAFGTPDELRPILREITAPVELFEIESGDHSFKVTKASPIPQQHIFPMILDHTAQWLQRQVPRFRSS
jgi:predicted alpha/beta-hydrolase family hydrolase